MYTFVDGINGIIGFCTEESLCRSFRWSYIIGWKIRTTTPKSTLLCQKGMFDDVHCLRYVWIVVTFALKEGATTKLPHI